MELEDRVQLAVSFTQAMAAAQEVGSSQQSVQAEQEETEHAAFERLAEAQWPADLPASSNAATARAGAERPRAHTQQRHCYLKNAACALHQLP